MLLLLQAFYYALPGVALGLVAVSTPEIRNPKPKTWNPKPETQDPKLQTLNPKTQTLNPEP